MPEFPPIGDDEGALFHPMFAPIGKPVPIPSTNAFDAPLVCLQINEQWVAHLLGVMDALDQPDAWQGTEVQVDAARQNVRELMNAFSSGVCVPMVTGIRFVDCVMEQQIDGEWIPVEEFEPECFVGPTGETGPIGPIGPIGPPGSDATATIVRTDPAGFGNMEQNISGAGYTDIANSDFVRRDGAYPMIGGLEINNAQTTEPALTITMPVGSTQSNYKIYSPDGFLRQELLSTGRFFHYGSTGNIRFDGAGNDIAYTRDGANWLSASANTDNLTSIRMRVGGVDTICVYTQGRTSIGTPGFRNVALHIQALNAAHYPLIVRPATSSALDIISATDSAGVTIARVKIDGSLEAGANDAGTNTYPDGLSIYHGSTGTPTAGFGVGMRWQGKTSTTAKQNMALLRAVWETATHATRKAQIILEAYDTAAREVLRGGANGSGATLGVLGQTPSPIVNVGTIDCEGNEAAKSALDVLMNFGFITGVVNLGTAPPPPEIPEFLPAFSQCQYATSQALVMFWHYYKFIADYLASDLGVYSIDDRREDLRKWGDVRYPDFDKLDDFIDWFWLPTNLDLTNVGVDDPDYIAHISLMQAYFESQVPEILFCYMDANGIIDATQYDLMMAQIEATSTLSDTTNSFYKFMSIWDRLNMADFLSIASHSAYVYDGECDEEFDCENWNVFMNFPINAWSASVTPTSGEYAPGVGYVGYYSNPPPYSENPLIEILFHVTRAEISVYQEFSVPTDQTYVYDITNASFTEYTPLAGGETIIWTGNAPGGIRIFHGTSPSHIDSLAEIISINLFGIGTIPTP